MSMLSQGHIMVNGDLCQMERLQCFNVRMYFCDGLLIFVGSFYLNFKMDFV